MGQLLIGQSPGWGCSQGAEVSGHGRCGFWVGAWVRGEGGGGRVNKQNLIRRVFNYGLSIQQGVGESLNGYGNGHDASLPENKRSVVS